MILVVIDFGDNFETSFGARKHFPSRPLIISVGLTDLEKERPGPGNQAGQVCAWIIKRLGRRLVVTWDFSGALTFSS